MGSEQPVLVYAFLALPEASLASIEAEVNELYEREGLTSGELKSSTLIRSSRGRTRYEQLGHIASNNGARAFMSMVEKRYQVCVMIVETYLDPEWNDWAPRELSVPRFRQRVADACCDHLSDADLVDFLKAVRSDDPHSIVRIGGRLSRMMQFHPDEFVSHAARSMESDPDRVFRYAKRMPELPRNSNLPASQYATFYPGLELVDAYLETIGDTGTVVRDEDLHFGDVLDLAFLHAEGEGVQQYRRRKRLTNLRACLTAQSSNSRGIQLADLAAGIFGRLGVQAVRRKSSPEFLTKIACAWRTVLAPPDQHYLMVSDSVLSNVALPTFGEEIA